VIFMVSLEARAERKLIPAPRETQPIAGPVEVSREANGIEVLRARHQSGEILSGGQYAKILHLFYPEDQITLREKIREQEVAFWKRWSEYRCEPANGNEPRFDHVMRLLPGTRIWAREFIAPQKGDMINDLFSGPGVLQKYFSPKQRKYLTYVGIDRNPDMEQSGQHEFDRLRCQKASMMTHDLSFGLPPGLKQKIAEVDPSRVIYTSSFGLTYLPRDEMMRLIHQCLDPEINGHRPTSVIVHMLRDGKFNPEKMQEMFGRTVVPKNLHRPKALMRARASVTKMREFGEEIPRYVPIWYPYEIRGFLEAEKLRVVREDNSLLWEMSTAMEIVVA